MSGVQTSGSRSSRGEAASPGLNLVARNSPRPATTPPEAQHPARAAREGRSAPPRLRGSGRHGGGRPCRRRRRWRPRPAPPTGSRPPGSSPPPRSSRARHAARPRPHRSHRARVTPPGCSSPRRPRGSWAGRGAARAAHRAPRTARRSRARARRRNRRSAAPRPLRPPHASDARRIPGVWRRAGPRRRRCRPSPARDRAGSTPARAPPSAWSPRAPPRTATASAAPGRWRTSRRRARALVR